MKKSMLDDLSIMLQTARDFKQEFILYRQYAEKSSGGSYAERNFISNTLMRMSFINLHQLTSLSGYDYFSLWNFWARIERGEYIEGAICPLTLSRWRQSLLVWREQIEIVKDLRRKYAAHPVPDVKVKECVIALKDVDDMFGFIEAAILEAFNSLVNGNFTHIGTFIDPPVVEAGNHTAPVVNLTFNAA